MTSLPTRLEGAAAGKNSALLSVDADKFWSRVQRGSDGDCWPWKGYRTPRGYGTFAYAKAKVGKAHRIAYSLAKGLIPDGMLVCHSCDNPPCCNPAHLWIGSDADNNADRHSKGRTVSYGHGMPVFRPIGEQHASAKLTLEDVQEIRSSPLSARPLAAQFGVTFSTICRVRRGETWGAALIRAHAEQKEC